MLYYSGTSLSLYSIWGSASTDVFAVGEASQILHYDGNQWNTMTSDSSYPPLTSIWGSSSTDVFAVGGWNTILHYDGNQWTPMKTGNSFSYPHNVWGSSSTNVLILGNTRSIYGNEQNAILHYDGNQWKTTTIGNPYEWIYNLRSLWGSFSSNVFTAVSSSDLLHYDGKQWNFITNFSETNFYDLWGSSSTDMFAVGNSISHSDGKILPTPYDLSIHWFFANLSKVIPPDTNNHMIFDKIFTGVWGSSSTDVFTVGSITVWDGIRNTTSAIIYHYDGKQWTSMNTGTDITLTDIWGSSSTDVFAVGEKGTILHYDGSQWSTMNSGTSALLLSIWGYSNTDVFAVGWGGTILHYDGSTWTTMNSGTLAGLTGIWGNHDQGMFVVGWTDDYTGIILHYDGDSWTYVTNTPFPLKAIWGSLEGDIFAIGNEFILHCATDCTQTTSHFKVSPRSYNFWNVTLGQPTSKDFTVTNTSNNDIQLQPLVLTNPTDFTLNNDACSNKLLAPTDTCQVTVNFQPQAEGTQFTKVTLPSNLETIEIPISGTGCSTTIQQQAFNLYPESPNLGATIVGNSVTLNQTVSFTASQGCGEPLYLDKIEVTGKDAAEFTIQSTPCYYSNYGNQSYSSCQFNTTFQPTTVGDKQAELTFKLLNHEDLPMPTVALQAKAVDTGQAQLQITPTEHDFGTVIIGRGSSESLSLVVTNLGEVSLTLDNITLTGDNAADFSLESWSCNYIGILHPNAQCYLNVWFKPSSLGQKQANLTLTSGNLTAEALLTGIAEESKDCTNLVTIESVQSGRWDATTTWSTSKIPATTDIVRLNSGHTLTGQELAQIKTLCVQTGATLESLNNQGTALEIQATDYLENHGTIRGKDGSPETQSACTQDKIGTEGCAQPGASILLKVGTGFDKYGKMGDWWWEGSGGPILNTGEIIAGKGGDGSQYGAPGGDAIVLGRNNTNTNRIQAGDGGNILGTGIGEGGHGGLTQLWGKLGGPGHLYVQNGAKALAGNGGNCNPQSNQQTGGNGGNLWLVSLPDVHIEGGITQAGSGGQGCARPGQDGFVQIEPNVISLAGAATHVKGGNIAIYGGNDWTLDLSNLSGTVIEASGTLTLAVGKGGLIDFRNSTGQILTAKEVQIFTDNLLLNSGKKISDYLAAEKIVIGPSKVLRNVSLSVANKLFGNPGEVLSIPLVIANNGPEKDNYTLTVKDSAGNILNQLAAVEVEGLNTVNLAIDITIPVSNKVIFTAVSQADKEVSSSSEVILTTMPVTSSNGNQVILAGNQVTSDGNQVIPDSNQVTQSCNKDDIDMSNQVTLECNQVTLAGNQVIQDDNQVTSDGNKPTYESNDVVIVEQPTLNICNVTTDGIIDWTCINKEQILTDVTLESNAKVSGGQLAGMIDNQGFVSQVIIQPDTILKGGKLSGYIVNQGTLIDFEFVGAQVSGGTLAGQVINNSLMGGVFKDVQLAADTHLIGGYLQGEIKGEPAALALLEDLIIQSGSHLADVKIGKNVTWSAGVVFEDNVQFVEPMTYCNPARLTEIVPVLPSLDLMVIGTAAKPCSQLVGGLSTDGKVFQRQVTVTRAEWVEVLGRVAPDLRQVNQVVEWVLFAAYRVVEMGSPLYFMVDAQGRVLPWDGEMLSLVAFKESVRLEAVQSLRLYRGKFPVTGRLEVQFGYRLADGVVVLNAQPLEVVVVE